MLQDWSRKEQSISKGERFTSITKQYKHYRKGKIGESDLFRKKAGTNQFITTDWLNRLLVFLAGNMEPEIPWDFAKRMQGKEINKDRPKRKRSDKKKAAESWKRMSGNCASSFKGKEKTWYRGPLIMETVRCLSTVRLCLKRGKGLWRQMEEILRIWFRFQPNAF